MSTCYRNLVVAIVILITVSRMGVADELYTGKELYNAAKSMMQVQT